MKKSLFYIQGFLAICISASSFAQPTCPPEGLSTNPDGPVGPTLSGSPLWQTNVFDWQQNPFFLNSPHYQVQNPNPQFPVPYPFIGSPFFQINTQLDYLSKGLDSDFYWEDGWELVRRDFGFLMGGDPRNPDPSDLSGQPNTGQNLVAPYLILYNKFEAKLRVLCSISSIR